MALRNYVPNISSKNSARFKNYPMLSIAAVLSQDPDNLGALIKGCLPCGPRTIFSRNHYGSRDLAATVNKSVIFCIQQIYLIYSKRKSNLSRKSRAKFLTLAADCKKAF